MRAMILAAGLGTRLRPLTGLVPKPMVPVANRPVLEHLLRLLRRHGITEVAVNLHWFPQVVTGYVGDGDWLGMRVRWSFEPSLLGTAGGIKQVEDFLTAERGEPFLVLLGDILTAVDLGDLVRAHRRSGALVTMAVREVDDPARYGVLLVDGDRRVTGFRAGQPWGPRPWWSNCGVYVLDPAVLGRIPKGPYHLGDQVLSSLYAQRGAVFAHPTTAPWSDVGSLSEYRAANWQALTEGGWGEMPGRQARAGIWLGEHSWVADTATLQPPILVGARCRVESDARLVGPVVLGDDSLVESGAAVDGTVTWNAVLVGREASVTDAVIGGHTHVRPGSVVRGATIGERCVIGEGSMIGPVCVGPGSVVPAAGRLT